MLFCFNKKEEKMKYVLLLLYVIVGGIFASFLWKVAHNEGSLFRIAKKLLWPVTEARPRESETMTPWVLKTDKSSYIIVLAVFWGMKLLASLLLLISPKFFRKLREEYNASHDEGGGNPPPTPPGFTNV